LLLPLVLYTGTSPWKVTTQVADLFPASPPALSAFIPRMAHYVIQKSHSGRDSSGTVRTVIDALFQLEHGRTPEDILRVVQGLAALLRDPENDELRRTFTLWVKHLLCRKTEIIPTIDITLENDTMLTEVIDKWAQKLHSEGIEKGRMEGIEKGIERGRMEGIERGIERGRMEGIEKGIEKGIERGIERGIEKGRHEALLETAHRLLARGMSPEIVLETTGLERSELKRLFR
jgi:predicted transposase YdaD